MGPFYVVSVMGLTSVFANLFGNIVPEISMHQCTRSAYYWYVESKITIYKYEVGQKEKKPASV